MNRIFRPEQLATYEQDYARWCSEQGSLLRAGRFDALDRENLAEEIESLGRSDKREIQSRLKVLLTHLLTWRFQPEKQKGAWKITIRNQRIGIAKLLKESPSLRSYPSSVLVEEYGHARADAIDETGLPEDTFPVACPFTAEQVLADGWLPDTP